MASELFKAAMVVNDVIDDGNFRCLATDRPRHLVHLEANGTYAIAEALAEHWGIELS